MQSRRPTAHDPETGHDVGLEVLDRRTDPLTQTFSERWHWTVSRNGALVKTYDDELRLRWTYRQEMRYLLELTRFEVRAEYADFTGSAPRYGGEQVWVAEAR